MGIYFADSCTLGCLIVLPVPGPGFQGRFWAGFGRIASVNGPTCGPNLSGLSAGAAWDRFWSVHISLGPNPGQKPVPEARLGDRNQY